MLFCLAFSKYDAERAIAVLDWMHELHGKLSAHSVAVCHRGTPQDVLMRVHSALSKVFEKACVSTICEPYEPTGWDDENKWPGACNTLFLATIQEMVQPRGLAAQGLPERVKEHDSFYYFEPDCVPLSPGWWEAVQYEYAKAKASGKDVLAYVARHRIKGLIDEQYPVGTGVYPRNILHHSKLLREETWQFPNEKRQPKSKTIPWDIWARNDIMPRVKEAEFLLHRHRAFNFCHLSQVSGKAVVHGCKDDSMLNLAKAIRYGANFKREYTFLHSGDMGDIIYSLPSLKWFWEQTGVKCRYLLSYGGEAGKIRVREPLNDKKLEFIKPLLLSLPYISCVQKWDGEVKPDVNFFLFRENRGLHENLALSQLKFCHAPKERYNEPWIDLLMPKLDRVVIARSPRYQNDKFPWKEIVRKYRDKLLFVGLPEEYTAFCQQNCNPKDYMGVEYRKVENLLEMAQVISSAALFIGNQSTPYALASALGIPAIQETMLGDQNCIFPREGNQFFDGIKFKDLILPDIAVEQKDEVQGGAMVSEESLERGSLSSGVHSPIETPFPEPFSLSSVPVGILADELSRRPLQEVLEHLDRTKVIVSKKWKRKIRRKPKYLVKDGNRVLLPVTHLKERIEV